MTDIKLQSYCEMKLDYTLKSRPPRTPTNRPPSSQPSPSRNLLDSPRNRGIELHKKRKLELGLEDYEQIQVTTAEDRLVLNLVILYRQLKDFHQKGILRELPIYGRIGNMVLSGYIDELRFDSSTNTVLISELKTCDERKKSPKKVQKDNRLQVALYTNLLTNLSNIDIQLICARGTTVEVDGTKDIPRNMLSHCPYYGVRTPYELVNPIKQLPQVEVSYLQVEYVHAKMTDGTLSEQPIEKQNVRYDEKWLLEIISYFEPYWFNERPPRGISDIEDFYEKCNKCDYKNICTRRREILDSNEGFGYQSQLPSTSRSVVRDLTREF